VLRLAVAAGALDAQCLEPLATALADGARGGHPDLGVAHRGASRLELLLGSAALEVGSALRLESGLQLLLGGGDGAFQRDALLLEPRALDAPLLERALDRLLLLGQPAGLLLLRVVALDQQVELPLAAGALGARRLAPLAGLRDLALDGVEALLELPVRALETLQLGLQLGLLRGAALELGRDLGLLLEHRRALPLEPLAAVNRVLAAGLGHRVLLALLGQPALQLVAIARTLGAGGHQPVEAVAELGEAPLHERQRLLDLLQLAGAPERAGPDLAALDPQRAALGPEALAGDEGDAWVGEGEPLRLLRRLDQVGGRQRGGDAGGQPEHVGEALHRGLLGRLGPSGLGLQGALPGWRRRLRFDQRELLGLTRRPRQAEPLGEPAQQPAGPLLGDGGRRGRGRRGEAGAWRARWAPRERVEVGGRDLVAGGEHGALDAGGGDRPGEQQRILVGED
jgi:hypothetical protein